MGSRGRTGFRRLLLGSVSESVASKAPCSVLYSRAVHSLELRIHSVEFDSTALELIHEAMQSTGQVCLLAHRPGNSNYLAKEAETRVIHKLTATEAQFVFLEVSLTDPSEFAGDCLKVSGERIDGFSVLRCGSPAIPNAIAAILLHLRDTTHTLPVAYFGWTEGHPLAYVFKYIFLGEGETAPVTREILREVEPDPKKRPLVIVG